MAFILSESTENIPSSEELELKFLRHLAYRASIENGKYLSERDKLALKRLQEAHCQDTASTSVADYAIEEFLELNPNKTKVLTS